MTGTLSAGDCTAPGGVAFADYYQFTLAADGPVTLELDSRGAARPMVATLLRMNGEVIESRQTSASTRAILGGQLAAGTYVVVVSGNEAGRLGTYDLLSASTMPAAFGCSAVAHYSIGTTRSGTVEQVDCPRPDGSAHADYYQFVFPSAGSVAITVDPDAANLGVSLALFDVDGNAIDSVRIAFGAPQTVGGRLAAGRYIVMIGSHDPAHVVSYTLSSAPTLPPFAECVDFSPHTIGTSVTGALSQTDCLYRTKPADHYDFTLAEAGAVSVTLTPTGTEPLVIMLSRVGGGFVQAYQATRDAPASVGGSLIAGRYIVSVIGSAPGQAAGYSFTSTRTMPPPPPPVFGCATFAAYTLGTTVEESLAATDCTDTYGQPFDRYDFTLAAERTITFEMHAPSRFAPVLYLFDAAGAVIAEDPHAGGSPRSRITMTLQAGRYSIGAGMYGGGFAPYTLTTS